jgi:hypothetical protein
MHIIEPQAEESSPGLDADGFPDAEQWKAMLDEVAGSVDPATYDDDFDYDCTDSDDDALDERIFDEDMEKEGGC